MKCSVKITPVLFRWLTGWIQYGLAALLLVLLFSRVEMATFRTIGMSANPVYLLAAMGIILLAPGFAVLRWYGTLWAVPRCGIRLPQAFRATMLATVLNSVLPSKGGDLAKAVLIRKTAGFSTGVGSVVLERLIDLFFLGCLGFAGYASTGLRAGLYAGIGLAAGVPIAVFSLYLLNTVRGMFPSRLKAITIELSEFFGAWRHNYTAVCLTLVGSAGVWISSCSAMTLLACAVTPGSSWTLGFAVYPLGVLAGLLPVTISGIGVRDAVLVVLLAPHIGREAATFVAVGYTAIAYWWVALCALPFAWQSLHALRSVSSGNAAQGSDERGL